MKNLSLNMIEFNEELWRKLIELRETTLDNIRLISESKYYVIVGYIDILEYCILHITPETCHTFRMITGFIKKRYRVALTDYETFLDEVIDKIDKPTEVSLYAVKK